MCGLAGIYRQEGISSRDVESVKHMSELLQHRISEVKTIREQKELSPAVQLTTDPTTETQKLLKRIQRFFQLKN